MTITERQLNADEPQFTYRSSTKFQGKWFNGYGRTAEQAERDLNRKIAIGTDFEGANQ